MSTSFQQLANFIWSVADLLRGPYRPPQYERVMLPLTVLRRFDAVLAPSKESVLKRYAELSAKVQPNIDAILNNLAKDEDGKPLGFHNHSQLDFYKLKGDPDNVGRHLADYIASFSENIRKIFERFEFDKEIEKLEESNRLYQVVAQFAEIDLHPRKVDNITMGLVFEDLIRRFNESANETAGDHFTPREVIQLMVNLLLEPDTNVLTQAGVIVTICDPACGTGGMLAEAQNWIRAHNEQATVKVYGQDYNPRSYAVAASDLLIKGQKDSRVELGNTLTDDRFSDMHRFDYLLANPPFGVDWKAEKKEIDRWPNFRGYTGKLPRINDGALLFLLHMISKFAEYQPGNKDFPGSRAAIVFNGSPLFTSSAGSGESDIRRWIIERDMLEAIVALPEQMFYNTGIGTFVWVVTNRKAASREKKIQLIDARERYTPMKRSLGDKRRYLDQAAIDAITRDHGLCSKTRHWVRQDKDGKPLEWRELAPTEKAPEGHKWNERTTSRVFHNIDFGYRRITVLRPLRLRFEITDEARERFLNTCPELYDALQAVQDEFGTEPYFDWNRVWDEVQQVFKHLPESVEGWAKGAKGTVQKKIFRDCFTTTDPDAVPVIAKRHKKGDVSVSSELFPQQTLPALESTELYALLGLYAEGKALVEYEPDPGLKDAENIPLKEDIVSYVLREVRPYVADAWIDRETLDEQDGGIGKVGYEINFNRVFFQYQPPRPLHEIEAELAEVERRIMGLLRLEEKRAALISRVVTHGLDPSAPLKPSGQEWLGEIPKNWKLWRLKHLASEPLSYGANEVALEDNPSWPRFVRITDIAADGSLRDETFKSLPPEIAEPFLLEDGDLLFARSGATVGKSFIYRPSWGIACFAGYLIRFRCDRRRVLPDYLNLFAQSSAYWHQVSTGMIQATIQNFSAEKYADIIVPLPPITMQQEIVEEMAKEQSRFDGLTLQISNSLALMKEHRAALITAAVTGQIPLEEMTE